MSEDTKDSAAEADVKKIVKKEIAKQMGDVWAVLKRLKNAAEVHWGVDIDRDGKIGGRAPTWSLLAVLLVSVVIAMAIEPIHVWYDGDAVWGTAKIMSDNAGTATLTVDAISADITGAVTLGAGETVDFDITAASNVTNGQAVALSGGVNQLNSIGAVANGTNTITLSATAAANVGKVFYIVAPSTATNNLAIAKTGTWVGAAVDLAAGEMLTGIILATNKFAGIGQ